MKTNRGFASILIVLLVVVVGAGVYAVVDRSVLKGYFMTGEVPAQEQKVVADTTTNTEPVVTTKSVTDSNARVATTVSPPSAVAPKNGLVLTPGDGAKQIVFRWTPIVPKPQTVTYRLKVWQLMQGQSGTAAMRSNQPIVTKDVDNITQVEVSGIYTGPCRPPYLCEFVWSVEAVSAAGMSTPSTPFTFSVSQPAVQEATTKSPVEVTGSAAGGATY